MPAFDPLSTTGTTTLMNAKLDPLDSRRWNLALILAHHPGLFHLAVALRTLLWQRHLDPFVHLFRNRSPTLATVLGTSFPSRLLGIGFRITSRERRGLPLAGSQGFFQQAFQTRNLSFHIFELPLQARDLFQVGLLVHSAECAFSLQIAITFLTVHLSGKQIPFIFFLQQR